MRSLRGARRGVSLGDSRCLRYSGRLTPPSENDAEVRRSIDRAGGRRVYNSCRRPRASRSTCFSLGRSNVRCLRGSAIVAHDKDRSRRCLPQASLVRAGDRVRRKARSLFRPRIASRSAAMVALFANHGTGRINPAAPFRLERVHRQSAAAPRRRILAAYKQLGCLSGLVPD